MLVTRVGGDGIDVSGPDDAHSGPSVVLHAHADADGDARNDSHDKHDPEHNASNCSAPKEKIKVRFQRKFCKDSLIFQR